jgi:hypothetical protein
MSTKVQNNSEKTSLSRNNNSLLLDTLAQPGINSPEKVVNPFKKRAVAKYKTVEIILPLIDLDSPLKKSYWNTFNCVHELKQEGKKIIGQYCNNRWCIVCNRIRTAKLINGYLPVIKSEFREPMFVTLTIPNVPAVDLRQAIAEITRTIIKINNLFRHLRDFRLKGIRKIECTYNEKHKDFHPHFHILVESKLAADQLVEYWLKNYPEADKRGQDIRPADQNSLIELFKYSTKITAKSKDNAEALDIMFKALYKKRVFQPIGLKKVSVSEDVDEIQAQEVEALQSDIDYWYWHQEVKDWLNSSGELLTAY